MSQGNPPEQQEIPPPPPPKDAIAFIRWMLAFWRARRRYHPSSAQETNDGPAARESTLTVAIAISTDLAMLVAKVLAAALSGSTALFAESLHTLSDTANQLLLLNGLRHARTQPDLRHPFGYGAEMFFWSLLAALGIFIVGGALAMWEGVQSLLHPGELRPSLLGFAVLGFGCVLDGTSWLVSYRQLRGEATRRGIPFKSHVRSTTDTAVTAVYYEDSAAIIGNVIALVGLGMHQVTGSPMPDAIAGIAVGVLLAVVGLQLARRNRDLLTNRSASPIVLDRIRGKLAANPEIAGVGKVASIFVGPHQLLVIVEVQPQNDMSGIGLCQLLDHLRGSVVEAIQQSAVVFLMPVVAVEEPPSLTPWDREYWLRLFPDDEQT